MHIVYFRQDLRIADNPALKAAANSGGILPIYILDDINSSTQSMGGASRVWLHHALQSLNNSLSNQLKVFSGDPKKILLNLCDQYDVQGVYWNRCYEPWRIACDKDIKESLRTIGIPVNSFNGSLLWEPWEVLKADNTPYKVFTPYFKKGCLNASTPRLPINRPEKMAFFKSDIASSTIEDLQLLPSIAWHHTIESCWDISEKGALNALHEFLENSLADYKEGRNFPNRKCVSRLSPYLHFGQISPHQVWHEVSCRGDDHNIGHFLSELGWREFSHSLLYHFPSLPSQNLQAKFDAFPWQENPVSLKAWQMGQTGYPIVDAGMRELWQTGYMHNRIRMIAGSFLVKNLLLDWRHGAEWFWGCLVDADLANNSASWQWVAGCGADAAPYFRVFNPITQGEKFDPTGEYTRRYVPELDHIPDKYLFKPWEAPDHLLKDAGIKIGEDYPQPIVDIKQSRLRALEAFKSL